MMNKYETKNSMTQINKSHQNLEVRCNRRLLHLVWKFLWLDNEKCCASCKSLYLHDNNQPRRTSSQGL